MRARLNLIGCTCWGLTLAVASILHAQATMTVDETVARQNLLKHADPTYPPIAQVAHVSGDVVVLATIASDGHIANVKVVSGPAMLVQAAVDAVKSWIFKPFLQNGSPVMVDVKLVLPFGAPVDDAKEEKVKKAFYPVWDECRLLVGQHADPAKQAETCERAAEIADNLTLDSSLVARRSAYVFCATSKLRNKDAKGALACADRAVAVIRLGHDDASGMSNAYMVRAQAEMQTGNLSAADADLTTAEDQQRAALKTPTGQDLSKSYTYALKVLLTFHAQILTAYG